MRENEKSGFIIKKLYMLIIFSLFFTFIFSLNNKQIFAADKSETQKLSAQKVDKNGYVSIPYLDGIGKIIPGEKIYLGGVENELYCTFEDANTAIQDLKNTIPNLLNYLMLEYNLSSLSDNNWKQYQNALYEINTNTYNDNNTEYIILRNFLDIYADYERNEEILNSDSLDKIQVLLPYYSTSAKSFMNDQAKKATIYSLANTAITPLYASAGLNVSSAVNYATSWAYSRNPIYPDYGNGDCTNFASQILLNGGISMVYTGNTSTGWWYNSGSASYSWRLADTFARYMGVGYTCTSIYSLSININQGDFISADFDSNGSWDHIGFVTGKTGYYNASLGYYDFRVAQHSKNYNLLVSTSDNTWENIRSNGGYYGRVRR